MEVRRCIENQKNLSDSMDNHVSSSLERNLAFRRNEENSVHTAKLDVMMIPKR